MARRYREQELEQAVGRTAPGRPPVPDFDTWRKEHADVVAALRHRTAERTIHGPLVTWVIQSGRNTMRTRQVKFGAVAAVLLIGLAVITFNRQTGVAWSMEQTMAAIEQVKTLQIEGTTVWSFGPNPERLPFRFWVQPPAGDVPLQMRGEVKDHIMIARGDTAYEYWSITKTAEVQHGPSIMDLKYWYKAAELTPWLISNLPKMVQEHAEDWTQRVEKDPATGRTRIVATCKYPPSNMSFLLLVDPETNLLEGARLWNNLQFEGEPCIEAKTFLYNQELPEGLFELPAGTTIVDQKEQDESRALFQQAENLFHQEKQYAEAIKIYEQVHSRWPKLGVAEVALMMKGLCYRQLGQPDKEIETLEQAVNEYSYMRGWVDATWFYLGCAYRDQGQIEKALDAFASCLAAGDGVRDPEKFPLKDAREAIAKMKGQ